MAALYVVAAWLIMQVAEVIIGLANLPEWILELPRNNIFSAGNLDFRVLVGVMVREMLLRVEMLL